MTPILQYLNALYKYSKKIERTRGGNFYILAIRGAFTMHPRFRFGKTDAAKLRQIKRTLFRSKLDLSSSDTFFYELDENSIMLHPNTVIDNMPVDYSLIVDSSISSLREKSMEYDNAVSKQNIEFLDILTDYIDRLCPKLANRRAAEAIQSFKTRPAQNLYEALQRILFYHQIIAQTGHTLNGLGRLDLYLDRFEADENTENLIKEFLKTLHRFYNFNSNDLLGDTGQIIILGGANEDGSYFHNCHTELILSSIAELRLPDPKALLRCSASMPSELLALAAECISSGTGSPLISNDDAVIRCLIDLGYATRFAHNYGVSACWEPLSIGNSLEQNNMDCIEYAAVMNEIILTPDFLKCSEKQDLYDLYIAYLHYHIDLVLDNIDSVSFESDPVLTLLTWGCLDTGKDISLGGALYNNYGLLSVGLSSAVNSLLNIEKYVFQDKLFTLQDIASAIESDYASNPAMEKLFSINSCGFGTDAEEAERLTAAILEETKLHLEEYKNRFGGSAKFGLSSPTYVRSGSHCGATADGRKSGAPLSTHISKGGDNCLTALPRFASKLEYNGTMCNGNVVDIMLPPSLVNGENRESFISYIRSCLELGVYQLQFNVVSLAELLDAKEHPELHKDLIVRVWGFSAYFNDLPEEYQDALIRRARETESAL